MDPTSSPRAIDATSSHPGTTVEVRARIPVQLRDQLEQQATRNFRSLAGEVAAACSSWIEQHGASRCVAPGQYGAPSVRLKSDPLNPGGYQAYPVTPSPSYPTNLPPGMNRNYSRPNVPGLY